MTAATWRCCPAPHRPGELLTRGDVCHAHARRRRGGTVRRATRRCPSWSGSTRSGRRSTGWRGGCRAPRAGGYVAGTRPDTGGGVLVGGGRNTWRPRARARRLSATRTGTTRRCLPRPTCQERTTGRPSTSSSAGTADAPMVRTVRTSSSDAARAAIPGAPVRICSRRKPQGTWEAVLQNLAVPGGKRRDGAGRDRQSRRIRDRAPSAAVVGALRPGSPVSVIIAARSRQWGRTARLPQRQGRTGALRGDTTAAAGARPPVGPAAGDPWRRAGDAPQQG